MKIFKHLVLSAALCMTVNSAQATPVDWTLDLNQTVYDFIQTYGTFTFDADTNLYSNVDVHLLYFNTNDVAFGINQGDANGFNYGVYNATGIFTFTFDSPLTNAGGTVTGTGSTLVYGEPRYWSFNVHAQSTATAVPEPEAYAMMLAGLGLVGFAARRKLSA